MKNEKPIEPIPCQETPSGCPLINETQMEAIAERAAEKAIEKLTEHLYREVGKNVLEKLFYIVGALAVAAYLWLHEKGVLG